MRNFDNTGKCLECNGVGYCAVNGVQRICPSCRGVGAQHNTPAARGKPQQDRKCLICNGLGTYKASCCDTYIKCPLCGRDK